MTTKILSGPLFVAMLKSGAANLEKNRKVVNDLNVFPVPDGDTGDNMSMTINTAARDARLSEPLSLEKSSSIIAEDVLLGARGNSGVILSRIIKGLANGFSGKVEATLPEVVTAFNMAVSEAYSAVAKPVEGTILTVLKDSVRYASSIVKKSTSLEDFLEALNDEVQNSLERTPDLLPSLKEAGVVDSGGVGLAYIFEGFELALKGETVEFADSHTESKDPNDLDISLFTEDSTLEFGYCTEFLLRLQKSKISLDEFSLEDFIDYLNSVGNSVVAFRDDTIVKAHVHTKTPGKVLSRCQEYGEFLKLKIENMTLQHNGATVRNNFSPKIAKPHKKYAIVAVASGEGIKDTFKSLGVDVIIEGGQTMNPSTGDFLEAYKSLDADTILVYPNNKNIKLSAEQSVSLFDKSKVAIIPTATIGEGYMAISMLDLSEDSIEKITKDQKEVISSVTTGIVSKASKSVIINDIEVKDGDYIGYVGDDIYVDDSSREDAIKYLAEKLDISSRDLAVLIYGKNVPKDTAEKVAASLSKSSPLTEIITLDGGQPIHDYLLILS